MAKNQNDYTPAQYVPDRANFPLDLSLTIGISSVFNRIAIEESLATVNYPPQGLPYMGDVVSPQMIGLQKARMITAPQQPTEDVPQLYRLGDVVLGGGGV